MEVIISFLFIKNFFNISMLFILTGMFLVCSHPSLRVLHLLALRLSRLILLKSFSSSLALLVILLVFSRGVLILLFYITIINNKRYYWNNYLMFCIPAIIFPSFLNVLAYKNSSFSSNLEIRVIKCYLGLVLGLMIFLLRLIVVRLYLYKIKFSRQIIK